MAGQAFVRCDNLVKIYKVADVEVIALQGLDLQVARGEVMALIGPSGSGKSTLLNMIGGLDSPSAGTVWVNGMDLSRMERAQRERYQRQGVGFLWQQPGHNLLPYLSALENVEVPMLLDGRKGAERRRRAMQLLDMVDLADRAHFGPDRLSGGEQQRVALAVALANNPPLLLADEPTGQIDARSAAHVFDALRRLSQAYGTTVIVVTHDASVVERVDRVVTMRSGRTSTEIRQHMDDETTRKEEWAILDRSDRLQLPRPFVQTLRLRERVKVSLEPDHLSVWPQEGEHGRAAVISPVPDDLARETLERKKVTGGWPAAGQAAATMIGVEGLSRAYASGPETVWALREVCFSVAAGQLAAIVGPSGSGKTTLLNLIAGLDEPTAGRVSIGGRSLASMSFRARIDWRRHEIGFVHQTIGLLPFLTVEENVGVPLRLQRLDKETRRRRTLEVLELVGLADRARHRAYELSGGEQQRVAIARALVGRPSLILADEPTGQLDDRTGATIMALLCEIVERTGTTVVIASHNPYVRQMAEQVLELRDGQLVPSTQGRHERSDA